MLSVTGAGRSPDAAAPPPQSVPRRSQLAARGSPSAVSARRSVRASTAGPLVCCSHHRPHLRRRRCHRRCHHCHRCRRQRRFVVVALCSKSTRLSDPVAVPGTRCLDSITTMLLWENWSSSGWWLTWYCASAAVSAVRTAQATGRTATRQTRSPRAALVLSQNRSR